VKILFFAQTRQATNCSEIEISFSQPIHVDKLWEELENRFPALQPLRRSTRLARNQIYAAPDEIFQNLDEVALIPPVSGG